LAGVGELGRDGTASVCEFRVGQCSVLGLPLGDGREPVPYGKSRPSRLGHPRGYADIVVSSGIEDAPVDIRIDGDR